jgi:hypothetical protein
MRKAEVETGKVYAAKVSDRLSPVRLDSAYPGGGWHATNLRTQHRVFIRSAQRLRFEVIRDLETGKWRRADG